MCIFDVEGFCRMCYFVLVLFFFSYSIFNFYYGERIEGLIIIKIVTENEM